MQAEETREAEAAEAEEAEEAQAADLDRAGQGGAASPRTTGKAGTLASTRAGSSPETHRCQRDFSPMMSLQSAHCRVTIAPTLYWETTVPKQSADDSNPFRSCRK